MESDFNRTILRYWWAPLLLLIALELLPLRVILMLGFEGLAWLPMGIRVVCQVALLIWVWPRLQPRSPFKVLLIAGILQIGLQVVAWRYLDPWLNHPGQQVAMRWVWASLLISPTVEVILLSLAFWLGRKQPEDASLGVATAAALGIMRGGWMIVGLGPLVAALWRDPLLFELCGGQADQERAARNASWVGLFSLIGTLFILLPLGAWSSSVTLLGAGGVALLAMLVGAAMWAVLGARWGRAGTVARTLTWIGLGLVALVILVVIWFLQHLHW